MELRRRCWQLFGLGLGIRLLWLGLLLLSPNRRIASSDSAFYDEVAWNLANGGGFTFEGAATAFHPPGYPLLLAGVYRLFGHSQGWAQLLGVLLSSAVPVLTVLLTVRLGLSRRTSLVAGLLVAAYPSQIFYSTFIGSEAVCSVLLVGGAIATAAKRYWSAALLLGLAALTRSVAFVFVPLVVLAMLIEQRAVPWMRRAGVAGVAILLAIAPVVPWAIRNDRVLGTPIFTTTSDGYSLWAGNSPGATGYYRSIPSDVPLPTDEVSKDAELRRLAIEHIAENPLSTIALIPRKLAYLFVPDISGLSFNRFENPSPLMSALRIPLTVIAQLYNAALLGLAAFSVRALWRRERRAASYLFLPTLAFVAGVVATHAENRYRAPVAWLFAIPAAFAMVELDVFRRAGRYLRFWRH